MQNPDSNPSGAHSHQNSAAADGQTSSVKAVIGNLGQGATVNIHSGSASQWVECCHAGCGHQQDPRQTFVCERCRRIVCLAHKDIEHADKVAHCQQCADLLRRSQSAAGQNLCQYQGCGQPLHSGAEFRCARCQRQMCRSHEDRSQPGFCLSCAETARSERFDHDPLNRPLTGEALAAAQALKGLSQPNPAFQARLWTDRSDLLTTRDINTVPRRSKGSFRLGDRFRLQVQTARDCYLTLIDFGTTGRVFLLLRNHPLRAGQPTLLTGPDADHEWEVGGIAGVERLKAIFTLAPLELFPGASDFSELGAMRNIVAEVQQAAAVLEKMPPGSWTEAGCEFTVQL
jgi:hypothetical protein